MSAPHRTTGPARAEGHSRRRDAIRLAAVILAVIALLLTSSALNWVTEARAANGNGPKKAVIVAGPVHSQTEKYRGYASEIADAAAANGMEVIRIFHPAAPKSRVKELAQGADLFVYAGHGNGWPSDLGPFQEDTKNGLGLDPEDPAKRDPNTVVYWGANWLRENIVLAPNAVVILSHLSYASGNASSGMPIPTREVAVERVDNFANGFLSIGARVVWALGWQPGADIINALYHEDATMDAVFMTRYREEVNPRNGWIGADPGYYDSVRIPGARIHIDPDPVNGYLRAVTGDLGFSTTAWRDEQALPPDTTPPVISNVRARQAPVTIAANHPAVPVFTPNGDGLSDDIGITFQLSEGAFLDIRVRRDGKTLRRWSSWAIEGPGTVSWNGRRETGKLAAEGKYNIYLTPTDRSGNSGAPAVVQVKLLNSMHSPSVNPDLFWARDGDSLRPTTVLKARLIREAAVSLVIRDRRGKVVRHAIDKQSFPAGPVRFAWDGKNDAGKYVPDDRYSARIRVTSANGSYAHEVAARHMPFMAWTPSWTRRRGDTVSLRVTTTEPLKGKPVVTANQRGLAKYQVPPRMIRRLNGTEFKVVINTRRQSKGGGMKVRVTGTDRGGGRNSKVFTILLK